jgi:hypothetical protein
VITVIPLVLVIRETDHTATRFGAAVFLEGQDVEQVWSAFLECWALVYTGYPRKTLTDA